MNASNLPSSAGIASQTIDRLPDSIVRQAVLDNVQLALVGYRGHWTLEHVTGVFELRVRQVNRVAKLLEPHFGSPFKARRLGGFGVFHRYIFNLGHHGLLEVYAGIRKPVADNSLLVHSEPAK